MQKTARDAKINIGAAIICGIVGFLLLSLLTMLAAVFINSGALEKGRGETITPVLLFLSAVIAGLVSSKKSKSAKAAGALISGLTIFTMLTVTNMIVCDNAPLSGQAIINLLIVTIGSLSGGSNILKRKKYKKRR